MVKRARNGNFQTNIKTKGIALFYNSTMGYPLAV
jgi:hypothetical protein